MSSEEIEQNDQQESEAPPEEFSGGEESTQEFGVVQEKQPMGKGTVAMFLVLAVAGAGTYFMYARTGPQSASAASDPKAAQVISQFITNRDKNLGTMQKMLRDTEAVVKQFLNYPSVKQVPLSGLSGNPFRMVLAATQEAAPRHDPDLEAKRREEERTAAKTAAANLLLQSIMSSGARKSCMLNNTLCTEGDTIDSFVIEKIKSDGVIVRRGTYRFLIPMQR